MATIEIDKIQSVDSLFDMRIFKQESTTQIVHEQEVDTVVTLAMKEINKELHILRPPPRVDMRRGSERSDMSQQSGVTPTFSESRELRSDDEEGVMPLGSTTSNLFAMSQACALQTAIDELQILGLVDKVPNLKIQLKYVPLADRYSDLKPARKIQIIENGLYMETLNIRDRSFYKVEQQRLYIQIVLQEAVRSLLSNMTCHGFIKRVKDFRRARREEQNLLNEVAYNKLLIPKIRAAIKKERLDFMSQLDEAHEKISSLKNELEDVMYLSGMQEKYIERWQNARGDQNRIRFELEEKEYRNTRAVNENKLKKEIRVHDEIMKFLKENIQEMQLGIEYWEEEYDIELEKIEMNIQIAKGERNRVVEQLEELKLEYERRTKVIEEWNEVREAKKREEELMEERIVALVKIQAWWRGIMVRRGLYKKSKKKSKKQGFVRPSIAPGKKTKKGKK